MGTAGVDEQTSGNEARFENEKRMIEEIRHARRERFLQRLFGLCHEFCLTSLHLSATSRIKEIRRLLARVTHSEELR